MLTASTSRSMQRIAKDVTRSYAASASVQMDQRSAVTVRLLLTRSQSFTPWSTRCLKEPPSSVSTSALMTIFTLLSTRGISLMSANRESYPARTSVRTHLCALVISMSIFKSVHKNSFPVTPASLSRSLDRT